MITVEDVRAAMVAAADAYGVEPLTLNRTQLLKHSGISRRQLDKLGAYGPLRFDLFGAGRDVDLPAVRGVQVRNNYMRSLERKVSEPEYLVERLRTAISDALAERPIEVARPRAWTRAERRTPILRELVAPMSDLHYGLIIDPNEVTGNAYNWTIASRRTARYAEQLIDWKPEHRDATKLRLGLNGDIVNGLIHSISEATVVPAAEQLCGATQILVGMLDLLSEHFREIEVECLPGNHDRWPAHRGSGRAVTQKWDSLVAPLFDALKLAFRHNHRIKFHTPKTPYCAFDLPGGKLGLMTHGDTVLTSGNVGRAIHVERIAQQVYALDASGVLPRRVDVVVLGHVHTAVWITLPNGCDVVINGAMPGSDPFAQSIGIHKSPPIQVMFEATAEYAVGDFRKIRLACADDAACYDDLIRPPVFS